MKTTLSQRRSKFPEHPCWHFSTKGNPVAVVEHDDGTKITVTIYKSSIAPGFQFCIYDDAPYFSRKVYPTKRLAKLGAFDRLAKLLDW